MVTKEVLDYIHSELARGISKETIRAMLVKSGWDMKDILQAESIAYATPQPAPQLATPIQRPATITEALQTYKQKTGNELAPKTISQFEDKTLPMAQQPLQTLVRPQTQTVKPRWHSLKVFMSIAFVILLGVAAYAYYTGYFVSAAQMSAATTKAIHEASAATYETAITIDTTNAKDTTAISILPELGPTMTLNTKDAFVRNGDSVHTSTVLQFASGSVLIDAETREVDNTRYIKATKLPDISLFDLSNYKDAWFSVDTAATTEIPLPDNIPIGASKLARLVEAAQNNTLPLQITQRYIPETIDGVNAYHFAFTFNNDLFSQALYDLNIDAKKVGNFRAEAWIGKNDHLPRKIVAHFTIQLGDDSASTAPVSFTAYFTSWNTPATIDAPTDATPLADAVEVSLKNAQDRSLDYNIRATIDNVHFEAEDYFDANKLSYKNLCTSANIVELLGGTPDAVCRDSVGSYITYAPLSETTTGFYCIDATGIQTEIPKAPKGTICK